MNNGRGNIKRVKSFLEYFDSEDLMSQDEIKFLSGDIKDELLQKIKEIESNSSDTTNRDFPSHIKRVSSKLTWEVPYLKGMELRSDYNKVLVFSKVINNESEGNNLQSICYIEITVNQDMSVLPLINCTIKVNEHEVFNEKSMGQLMDVNELVDLLKGDYLEMVNNWDRYNKSMLDKKSFDDANQMGFNPRSN